MMRLVLDGALDGYALPDKHWTARYPNSHIASSVGRVERPGEDVIFLVSTIHQGQLYIAGQGQNTGKAWFWNGGWQPVGTTYGVSPCAFGQGCLYVVIGPGLYQRLNLSTGESVSLLAPFGSQGVRYIDEQGNPISGDSTYRDGERFEWTARGDLTVYQGHETGAWINGGLLEPGDCRFVRFERRGNDLAVALTQLEQTRVILHWLTAQDIANLPTSPPIDPPPPPPPPPPEPTMQGITDAQYETLKAERAKITNSVLTPEQIGTVLNATAWKHRNDTGARLGLQAKPSGTSSIQPRTGTKVWNGLRIIDKDGKHWGEDVCGGCSVGQFNPVRATPGPADPAGFVAPVEPIGSVPDPPPPPPPPPAGDLEELKAEVLFLQAGLKQQAVIVSALNELATDLTGRVKVLELKPPPVATLPKLKIVADPSAAPLTTSREWSHAHTLRLKLEQE